MKALLNLVLVLGFCNNLYSQTFSDLMNQKDAGFGLNIHRFNGYANVAADSTYSPGNQGLDPDADSNALSKNSTVALSAMAGRNFPIINIAEGLAVGISPNLHLSLALSGGRGAFIDIPVFATLKYGTDATWSNKTSYDKKFGAGIGIGYQLSAGYTEATISTTGIGFYYARPAAMAEMSFVINQKDLFKIRFQANLGRSRMIDFTEQVEYPAEISFNQFGVVFIWTRYGT